MYGVTLAALRLSFSGTLVVDDFLNGETNGFARVFVASLSLRRLTAGEDMFAGQVYAAVLRKDETRSGRRDEPRSEVKSKAWRSHANITCTPSNTMQ